MNTDRNAWFKSSYSPDHGDCVEIRVLDRTSVGVRDSTDPDRVRLHIPIAAWTSFTRAAATGHLQRVTP